MEALAYCFAHMLNGRLPWSNLPYSDKDILR